jgi:hypothetical protein
MPETGAAGMIAQGEEVEDEADIRHGVRWQVLS